MGISDKIKDKAKKLGYLACGIIPANTFTEYIQYLDERVKTFPDSKKMYEPLYGAATPSEEAKSIIVCTLGSCKYKIPDSLNGRIGKFYMFDTRLAYTHEYRTNSEFETYLKTLGMNIVKCRIPDRWAAAKAGVGKFGRNNFIYSADHGSYISINTWAVDKVLDYETVTDDLHMSACNDNCHKCVQACPTKALSGSHSMDRAKCITYLTCSAKNPPDDQTKSQMGIWQYGCDACQDVCPMNKGKFKQTEDYPLLAEFEDYLKPENILSMDLDTYKNIVNPRFWYSGEEGLWLWKCNALRIMINSGNAKYHDLIKKCLNHEEPRIREVAEWGMKKLL